MKLSKSNILFVPVITLTISVIVLCVLVQILLQSSLNDMKSDASIINLAREQLILSHRVVNSVAADNLVGQQTNPTLENLQAAFAKAQHEMVTAEEKRADKEAYGKYLDDVNKAYTQLELAIGQNTDSDATNNDFIILLNKQAVYVKQLDAYIAAVAGNSDSKIERFRWEEIILTICSIIIITLEVLFIFMPALRKLKRQSQQFKAIAFYQSHIIRQPLANIKGLVDLVDTERLDAETAEIFNYLQLEADKLDDVIKEIISNTKEK